MTLNAEGRTIGRAGRKVPVRTEFIRPDVTGVDATEVVAETDEELFGVRKPQLPFRLGNEFRRRATPARHPVRLCMCESGQNSFS